MDMRSIGSRASTWFVVVSVVAALILARDFLLPVAMAVFVAFALSPIVRKLTRAGLPRTAATILTMSGVGALAAGMGWTLFSQLRGFVANLPEYRQHLRAKIADVRASVDGVSEATATLRELGHELSPSDEAAPATVISDEHGMSYLQELLGSVLDVSTVAMLVFLLATVMLLRWEDLRDRLLLLAGESDLAVTTHATQEASAKISSILRRQIVLNFVHGTAVGVILGCIGVPNPLVWGLLAGLLRFVPYLGPILGTVAPVLVACASSDGWTQTWITASSLVLLEIVTNNVVEPIVYGSCTGVSPLALLVMAAFWTWVWGPAGLVMSTPITVCLIVAGKHVPSLRFLDVLFGDGPTLSRGARLYHRLLADDADEAWELARVEAAKTSTVSMADDVLIPALTLVSTGRGDWRVDAESRERIAAIAHGIVDEWAEPSKPERTGDRPVGARILCLSARDTFDAVATRVFAAECGRRGIVVDVVGQGRLLAETLHVASSGDYDVVVVSCVAPVHFLHVRTLCKRVLAAAPDVELLVGLWGETWDAAEIARRLPDSPRIHVESSVERAVAWTASKHSRANVKRAPNVARS